MKEPEGQWLQAVGTVEDCMTNSAFEGLQAEDGSGLSTIAVDFCM